jgi:hypothetical protein
MEESILKSQRLAPDGSLISKNFSSWFGASRVVDDQGDPIVLFHGSTRGGILMSSRSNTYFSSSSAVASTYALDDYEASKGDEKLVQAFYVRMCEPLIVDAGGASWHSIEHEGRRFTTESLVAYADRKGHDGLIVRNVEDSVNDEDLPPSDIYVTFGKPSQFKSAIGNNGLYDIKCNDITDRSSERASSVYINAKKAMVELDQSCFGTVAIRKNEFRR